MQLYGFSDPSLSIATTVMTREASRISQDLSVLERMFPQGFGSLASAIRAW